MSDAPRAAREREDAFRRWVRARDKALLQAPARVFSGLCDGVCRALDGRGPLSRVGTRAVDSARTVVETATGIFRDVCLLPLHLPMVVRRHTRGGRVAGGLGRAGVSVALRLLGAGVDMVSRGAQGTLNAVLTLAFAEAPSRPLRPEEVEALRRVYGESLDYAVVRIKRGGATEWVRMAPHVVGNIVYMTNTWGGRAVFQPDGSFTRDGLETLIHEVGHVWQNQNGGGAYIHRALVAQFSAFLRSGSRHGAYAWREGCARGLPFEELNPEQQASLMEEVGLALRDHGQVVATAWKPPLSSPELRYVLEAWEGIRRGEGCQT